MKIAIIGKICSGKTTTADILIGLNNDFQKLSFAGKVKSIAVDLFDMEKRQEIITTNWNIYERNRSRCMG